MFASIRNVTRNNKAIASVVTGLTGGFVLSQVLLPSVYRTNNGNKVSNQNSYLDLKLFNKKVLTAEEMGGNRRKDAIRYEYYLPNTNEEIGHIEFNSKSNIPIVAHQQIKFLEDSTEKIIQKTINLMNSYLVEYPDITGYNFMLDKSDNLWIIDFEHAKCRDIQEPTDDFVLKFINGCNEWNPEFK